MSSFGSNEKTQKKSGKASCISIFYLNLKEKNLRKEDQASVVYCKELEVEAPKPKSKVEVMRLLPSKPGSQIQPRWSFAPGPYAKSLVNSYSDPEE